MYAGKPLDYKVGAEDIGKRGVEQPIGGIEKNIRDHTSKYKNIVMAGIAGAILTYGAAVAPRAEASLKTTTNPLMNTYTIGQVTDLSPTKLTTVTPSSGLDQAVYSEDDALACNKYWQKRAKRWKKWLKRWRKWKKKKTQPPEPPF